MGKERFEFSGRRETQDSKPRPGISWRPLRLGVSMYLTGKAAQEDRLSASGKAQHSRRRTQELIFAVNNIKELNDKKCPVPNSERFSQRKRRG
jgi:hypothetical protein